MLIMQCIILSSSHYIQVSSKKDPLEALIIFKYEKDPPKSLIIFKPQVRKNSRMSYYYYYHNKELLS